MATPTKAVDESDEIKNTDLLGYHRDEGLASPASYLKASDFNPNPDTTNADYYPSEHEPLRVGGTPSKYFGGEIPIFVGSGSLPPFAILDARKKAISQAAIANQFRKEQQQKQDKGRFEMGQLPDLKDPEANVNFRSKVMSGLNDFVQRATEEGKSQGVSPDKILFDPTTKTGKEFSNFRENVQTVKTSVNEGVTAIAKIRDDEMKNKMFLMPDAEKEINDFQDSLHSDFSTLDPNKFKVNLSKLKLMYGATDAWKNYVEATDKSKTEVPVGEGLDDHKARAGYQIVGVSEATAKQHAMETLQLDNGSYRAGLALGVGEELKKMKKDKDFNPLDATNEEIATAMAKSVTQNAEYKKYTPPEGDKKRQELIGDVYKDTPIKFKSYVDSAGTQSSDHITVSQGINARAEKPVQVSNIQGQVFDADTGMPISGLPSDYKIDPANVVDMDLQKAGKKRMILGTVSYYTPATDEEARMELLKKSGATIHNGHVRGGTEPTKEEIEAQKDEMGKQVKTRDVAMPYEENKKGVYGENASTIDKKMGKVEQQKKIKTDSSQPKENDEQAVQGGTAIFKNGKWQMK